jgi:hypothetical protein
MVSGHKTIFGEAKRSVREIESENIRFLQRLAEVSGMRGDIFETVNSNGQQIVRIKPQVHDLAKLYHNQHLPDGIRIRSVADAQGVKPPADIDVYNKVMQVRMLRRDRGLPYEDALYLMGRTNDAFNESKATQSQVQAQVAASQAAQAAAAQTNQFAREPQPGSGAPRFNVSDMSQSDYVAIMRIPKEQRSPEQVEVLKRIEESFNMRPGELTSV